MLLLEILITIPVILINTIIHACASHKALEGVEERNLQITERNWRIPIYRICSVIILMFLASIMEVCVWAITYRLLEVPALTSAEDAFYFSMVTYTTVGYGDIVMVGSWRVLSSFEAANGLIMFGWTTAVVMRVVQLCYPANRDA
jgi:hypothetical protein